MFDGMGMNSGTCDLSGADFANGIPGTCVGGFRNSGACAGDWDCQGAMTDTNEITHNPFGLAMSRAEVRSRHKIDLQQGYPGDNAATAPAGNTRWSLTVNINGNNDGSEHFVMLPGGFEVQANSPMLAGMMTLDTDKGTLKWDQAEFCIDRNPNLYPNPFQPGAIACRQIPYTFAECTAAATANAYCTDGVSADQTTCETAGETWMPGATWYQTGCTDGVSGDQTTCEAAGHVWMVVPEPFCSSLQSPSW